MPSAGPSSGRFPRVNYFIRRAISAPSPASLRQGYGEEWGMGSRE
jgi:hypothetical protein